MDALSNVLAVEEGPRGVRSNVIAPVCLAFIRLTPRSCLVPLIYIFFTQGPIRGTEGMDRLTPTGMEDTIARSIPLQRQGSLDDIPNTAVFLFSEAANWLTGQVIVSIH